jgi:periplasmic mercuric ion binding protein
MKTKCLVLVSLIFLLFDVQQLKAQEMKTATFKVYGSCDECKDRIETAANSVAGVNKAFWSDDTKMIEIKFDQSKTNVDTIQKAIAKVGHDTEKFRADDKTYEALPMCCHYDRKTK